MSTSTPRDTWSDGRHYEQYVGRWSRAAAREFLAWLAVPPGREWLDVGCGTGALTATVLDACAPAAVTGVEPSPGYLVVARKEIDDPRVRFQEAGAERLPLPDDSVDAAVSGLVLTFVTDPLRAVAEQRRAVRPTGVVGAYVWDYAGRMELMRCFWDAAVVLDPTARALDEGVRFPLADPVALATLWGTAGLTAVETAIVDVPTVFADFEDYWRPFLGGQGPAPGYCTSLDEARREALRERLRESLPVRDDGSIHLIARALAVKGTVP